jgi:hypothetical protein
MPGLTLSSSQPQPKCVVPFNNAGCILAHKMMCAWLLLLLLLHCISRNLMCGAFQQCRLHPCPQTHVCLTAAAAAAAPLSQPQPKCAVPFNNAQAASLHAK